MDESPDKDGITTRERVASICWSEGDTTLSSTTSEGLSSRLSYTVGSLIHEAERQRPGCDPNDSCQCPDEHVVELRLVVAALNRQRVDTYTTHGWQAQLVDFFDQEFLNSAAPPADQLLEKVGAVDKWLAEERLTDAETQLIDAIRKTWATVKYKLPREFRKFKAKFDDMLEMDAFISRVMSSL